MVSCLYTCVMQLFTAFSAGAVLAGNFIGDYILRKIHLWNVAVVVYIGWLLTIGIDGGFVLEFIVFHDRFTILSEDRVLRRKILYTLNREKANKN